MRRRYKHTGRIYWWNDARGLGKIRDCQGGTVFVHYHDVIFSGKGNPQAGAFRKGDLVEYEIEETEQGQQAIEVTLR